MKLYILSTYDGEIIATARNNRAAKKLVSEEPNILGVKMPNEGICYKVRCDRKQYTRIELYGIIIARRIHYAWLW